MAIHADTTHDCFACGMPCDCGALHEIECDDCSRCNDGPRQPAFAPRKPAPTAKHTAAGAPLAHC